LSLSQSVSRTDPGNRADAVNVVGLCKSYSNGLAGSRKKQVLSDLNFQIKEGQSFGIIGPNGAGKTTLVKALLTVIRPSAGTVRIFGENPERSQVRARIGYLPERLALPPAATPKEFLKGVCRLKGLNNPDAEIERQLARVGMGGDATKRIKIFSKGMKQRVGLAAALIGAPDLLVLDEPTDGLDPIGRAEFRNIVLEEKQRGATIVLNSHLLSEAERICEAVAILVRGVILRKGLIRDLCTSKTRWRARFTPAPADISMSEVGFKETDELGVYSYETDDPAVLNRSLDVVRNAGALLIELGPELKSLEEVLTEAVGP
jgi:ABC-2 type transport system ATP-binding protein